MSVDVQAEVLIKRSRTEIASVMFDPKSDCIWIGGLTNVFPLSAGLMQEGTKFQRVGAFLNRAFSGLYVVSRAEPESFVEIVSDEPFPLKMMYYLKNSEQGTLTKIRVQTYGENRINMPATLFAKTIKEKILDDLKRLKRIIEDNPDQPIGRAENKKRDAVISLRLKDGEAKRFWTLMDKANSINPAIDQIKVIRELIGLDQPQLFSPGDLKYFRSGKEERPKD